MFAEDLPAMFRESDFAEAALYDGTQTRLVIFDRSYLEQYGVVAGARPVAFGIAGDFADPLGKSLVIGGVTYAIRSRELQDDGATVLMKLERG